MDEGIAAAARALALGDALAALNQVALRDDRTRRWVAAPAAAFATNLLLCTALPAF
ncbi:conserved hypothetical protein [Bordetella bronchiseptica Bbr77]|nr:conserved hypothetical protein [Bordetella bronchiseptica Bbr77]